MTYSLFNTLEIVKLPEDQSSEYIPFQKGGSGATLVVSPLLNSQESSLLCKIMKSIERNSETDYVHTQIEESSYIKLAAGWLEEKGLIISFGIPFANMGFQVDDKTYTLLKIGRTYLLRVNSLSRINSSPELKQKLWSQLKKLKP